MVMLGWLFARKRTEYEIQFGGMKKRELGFFRELERGVNSRKRRGTSMNIDLQHLKSISFYDVKAFYKHKKFLLELLKKLCGKFDLNLIEVILQNSLISPMEGKTREIDNPIKTRIKELVSFYNRELVEGNKSSSINTLINKIENFLNCEKNKDTPDIQKIYTKLVEIKREEEFEFQSAKDPFKREFSELHNRLFSGLDSDSIGYEIKNFLERYDVENMISENNVTILLRLSFIYLIVKQFSNLKLNPFILEFFSSSELGVKVSETLQKRLNQDIKVIYS